MNFRRIVYNILRCRFGKQFTIKNNRIILSSKNQEIAIPIFDIDADSSNREILTFLESTGLANYIRIDVENIGDE